MTQDNPSLRLFVATPLLSGMLVTLDEPRAHYVRNVMRRKENDAIAVFNAESGEWEAHVRLSGKRHVQLAIGRKIASPRPSPDLGLAFATIKNKNELVVEKATELGVSDIHVIITQHSVVKSVNMEKLTAHAIEAAEQCERHDVPRISTHKNLASFLGDFPQGEHLLYGDETGRGKPLADIISATKGKKITILIGPEGGFSADEHHLLASVAFAHGFGMGPRILRADTAAIAALSCIQSATGDWSEAPHFKGAA